MTPDASVVRQHLAQIPDLFGLLELFLVRGATGEGMIGGPSGSRPPMDLGVIDLLDTREKRDTEPTRTADELSRDREAGIRRLGVLPTLAQWQRLIDAELWDASVVHESPDKYLRCCDDCELA